MSEYSDHTHGDVYGDINSNFFATDHGYLHANDYNQQQQYSLHSDHQQIPSHLHFEPPMDLQGYDISQNHQHNPQHLSEGLFDSTSSNPYLFSNVGLKSEDYYIKHDETTKRKLEEEGVPKRQGLVRPMKPVRQQSNPNMPRRSIRPQLNKSLSYNLESNPSKSLFEFNKRKPNFYLNLDHLKNPSIQSFDSNNSQTATPGNSGLYIQDSDLQFDNEFDMTPSMKPPGTSQGEYFDDDDLGIPTNFQTSDLTGFDFDIYDKNYYTNDDHQDNNNDNNDQNDNYLEYQIYPEAPTNGYMEHQYNQQHHNQHLHGQNHLNQHNLNELSPNQHLKLDDKKSPPTPLSNSPSRSPALYKSISNQSNSSVASVNSFKDVTPTPSNYTNTNTNSSTKKKKFPKGSTCSICGKYISRDLSRHLRIHDEIGRFRCVFPEYCSHKTGKFNRPYDYKKHLLHFHFVFDNKSGKTVNNLTEKLPLMGNCKHCNYRNTAQDWLENHVLTSSLDTKCKYVTGVPNPIH